MSEYQYITQLKKAEFPNASIIESYAFTGCRNLTSLIIDNVKIIEDGALAQTGIQTLSIPNIQYIYEDALVDCQNLTDICISSTTTGISAYTQNGNRSTNGQILAQKNTEKNCIEIIWGSIPRCSKVKIVDGIDNIARHAFTNCQNLIELNCNEVSGIHDYAFLSCSNLKTIILTGYNNVVHFTYDIELYKDVFKDCNIPVNVHIKNNISARYDADEHWKYLENNGQVKFVIIQ